MSEILKQDKLLELKHQVNWAEENEIVYIYMTVNEAKELISEIEELPKTEK